MLGLRLGSARSDHCVLGWEIRRATPDAVLLGARGALLFATFVRLDNVVARILWAAIEPRHRRVVRHLLERAAA